MSKILITGASGFLGGHLCADFRKTHTILGLYHNNPVQIEDIPSQQGDLSDEAQTISIISEFKPEVIIHTVALTNSNACELDIEKSKKTNVLSTKALIQAAKATHSHILFTSSDLVFDGRQAPYSEKAEPNPLMVYGAHKVESEKLLIQSKLPYTICRLPLLYGVQIQASASFIQPLIKTLQENKDVNLFEDEFRTPLDVNSCIRGIRLIIQKKMFGIIHLAGPERISRFDFGRRIQSTLCKGKGQINRTKQKEIKMPALRPRDVSLLDHRLCRSGFSPSPLDEAILKIRTEQGLE